MQTIKELYWEALRAPCDPANLTRNPYLKEKFFKKKFGKTKEERVANLAKLKQERLDHMAAVDKRLAEEQALGVGTPKENKEQRVKNAQARRKLGFIDVEIDADGNEVRAEDGTGVEDKVMEELEIKSTEYYKKVQEKKDRKKVPVVVPVQGISRQEYVEGMLRPEEKF